MQHTGCLPSHPVSPPAKHLLYNCPFLALQKKSATSRQNQGHLCKGIEIALHAQQQSNQFVDLHMPTSGEGVLSAQMSPSPRPGGLCCPVCMLSDWLHLQTSDLQPSDLPQAASRDRQYTWTWIRSHGGCCIIFHASMPATVSTGRSRMARGCDYINNHAQDAEARLHMSFESTSAASTAGRI